MKGSITFTVQNKAEIEAYAEEKGFLRLSDLARFALKQYMSRYPAKNPRAVQPEGTEGEIE